MTALDRLAVAAAHLRRANDDACHAVADALADFAAGRIDSIDAALGIGGKPGKAKNSTLARIGRRDSAIVAAAATHYSHLPTPEERGRAMHRDLTLYAVAGYRVDRRAGQPPANRRHLYGILEHCDDAIPGASMLGKIIRTAE